MITQIYAIQTVEDALACIEAGADYLGLLPPQHRPEGPRFDEVSEETARAIMQATQGTAVRVMLSVNTDPQFFIDMAVKYHPEVIHIASQGFSTNAEFRAALNKAAPGVKIMQAVPVGGPQAVAFAKQVAPFADYLLLDTLGQNQTVGVGASGNTHDREIDRQIVEAVDIPVIIAGGLGPDNVAEAVRAVRPWGVDSMTKTNVTLRDGEEGNPLKKDMEKVRKFCLEAKKA